MKSIHILVSVMALTLTVRAAGPDLTGTVIGSNGAALTRATVFIYTAGPKQGTSSFCPSCYADCAKKAQTDAQGRFEIPSLDPTLIFRLLTVAGGHESQFVPHVDPAKGEIKITLKALSEEALHSPLRVKGLVMDEEGRPLSNATIGPEGVDIGNGTRWGGLDKFVDAVAVSDDRGHFVLYCKTNVDSIHARVEARGVAQKWFEFKPGGDYAVRMESGVAVTGRIVRQGQPLPGVAVSLATTARQAGQFLDCDPIATGADGRFLIANVPSGREFSFCAGMDSLRGRGTVAPKAFAAGGSGTTLDLGDIAVQAGFRVEGKIALSDGKPIPPGVRLLLSRRDARDVLQQELGLDGSFKFSDVPGQSIGLSVRIKGYKFSKRNPSLDWLNGGIVGKVDGDIKGLVLLMEPGQWQFNNHPDDLPVGADRQPSEKPLRGVSAKEIAREEGPD